MRTALGLISCLLLFGFAIAQEKLPLNGDLKGAPVIHVNQNYSFNKSPIGYGKLKEFKTNPGRSHFIFKEERNSAWFLINVPYNGVLTFDLTPQQLSDDYDWMLFTYTADLEKSIRNETVNPLRSNNARNSKSTLSKTGIGNTGKSNFVKPGPGNNYSMPLSVKKGVKLALIVDNIYGGKGFDLIFRLNSSFTGPFVFIEGNVKDRYRENNIAAEVVVEDDSTGVLIAKTFSDTLTGRYNLSVPAGRPLNISASNPAYLFSTLDTAIIENAAIDFVLDTISTGSKLALYNIHFYPNKADILPSSYPELSRLLQFMKNRPEWAIKVTGHTNTNVFAPTKYLHQLSFNRALAVKKYLVENSIPEKRISCAGLGGKDPLIITNDPEAGLKNLRVEITLEKKH